MLFTLRAMRDGLDFVNSREAMRWDTALSQVTNLHCMDGQGDEQLVRRSSCHSRWFVDRLNFLADKMVHRNNAHHSSRRLSAAVTVATAL